MVIGFSLILFYLSVLKAVPLRSGRWVMEFLVRGYWLWLFFVLLLAARAKSINLVDYFRLRRDVRVRGWVESGRFFLRYRSFARWIFFSFGGCEMGRRRV